VFIVGTVRDVSCSSRYRPRAPIRSSNWCSGSPSGSTARSSAQGLVTHDIDNAYLAFDPGEEPPIHALLGSSIAYRIAPGPREGQKTFTLQTLPAEPEDFMARLAALVPKPRAHLTRYHGVFAIDLETCRPCGGRLRLSPGRGPRPAISRPNAARLNRFRCGHQAACTAYPPSVRLPSNPLKSGLGE
jgi:hypothetical protein